MSEKLVENHDSWDVYTKIWIRDSDPLNHSVVRLSQINITSL
jgi:hypothetical protein